jgi:cytochrome P450
VGSKRIVADIDDYTVKDPNVARCPFDYYSKMREKDPVHLDKGTGGYWIAKYADVIALALNHKVFSSSADVVFRKTFKPAAQRVLDEAGVKVVDTFVTSDPPQSDEYRQVGIKFFPPNKVTALLPQIQATCDRLIAEIEHAGYAELSVQFSRRLVGTIIAGELNLPIEDLDRFKGWAEVTGELMRIGISEEDEVRGVRRLVELVGYLAPLLERAVAEKKVGTVIHTIATATRRDGSPFSREEKVWMTFLSFTAANNSTVNMLNTTLRALAVSRDLQSELRSNLDKVPNFVEEMLRLEGSSQAIPRTVTEDVTVNGTSLAKGSLVWLCLGSANVDESRWGSDAAELRLDRDGVRKHVSFGHGRHQCIGMHLARAELRAAVTTVLRRLGNIRLADPTHPPAQLTNPYQRGLQDLHVRFEKL